jgi:ribosomal protein S18 acetylase RimI-like enzyme
MTYCGETMRNKIVRLQRSQFDQVSEVVGNAFMNDPVINYVTSGSNQKLGMLRTFCSAVIRYCQPYDHTYTTQNGQGVAAWIPPGNPSTNVLRLMQSGMYKLPFQLGIQGTWRFWQLLEIDHYRQQDMTEPHWYLMLLGVSPTAQGKGIGSSLLQPVLEQADRDRLPCYLETSTESAVRFYQKHGFQILRTGKINSNAPQFWTMKR